MLEETQQNVINKITEKTVGMIIIAVGIFVVATILFCVTIHRETYDNEARTVLGSTCRGCSFLSFIKQ